MKQFNPEVEISKEDFKRWSINNTDDKIDYLKSKGYIPGYHKMPVKQLMLLD